MAEEWGSWIEHDGNGCPLLSGTVALLKHVDALGRVSTYQVKIGRDVDHPDWDHKNFRKVVSWRGMTGVAGAVLAYRIRRPDALRRLIDLAADPEKGMPPRFPVEELA